MQRFPSYAVLYPLSYRKVVAIEHKTALKNPLRHLRQNRPKSYFAVDGKISTIRPKSYFAVNSKIDATKSNEMCGFMALYNYQGPLAPGINFLKNSPTHFYSLFISSSALHLIAERLASVTADTSFKVFGLT